MLKNKIYFCHSARIYYPSSSGASIVNEKTESFFNDANMSFGLDTTNNQYRVNLLGKRPYLNFPPFLGKN